VAEDLLLCRLRRCTLKKFILMLAIVILVIPAAACRVEKTGEDTYQVEAPTPEAERAAEQAKEATREAGQDIKEGARDAAKATGTALEEAGKEIQEHAKPGDQP
jgi:hypothetical protein